MEMSIFLDVVYAIQDTISGKFLRSIWLVEKGYGMTIYSDSELAEKFLSRLRNSKYIKAGYMGYKIEDLKIVELQLKPKTE